MRIELSSTVAGEVRCRLLRDRKRVPTSPAPNAAELVYSSKLQELTTASDRKPKSGFGGLSNRHTLGKGGRRAIREVGAVLDRTPPRRCVFLTGTLPGGTPQAFEALARWSGWVTQTLQQWVRDYAAGAQFFGVWEYQKRGALHVHLCVAVAGELESRRLKARWKNRWILALEGVSKRSGVDVFATAGGGTWRSQKWVTRTDVQTVDRSVAAYLSKYLSKGSNKCRAACRFPPSSWWFASSILRKSKREERRVTEVLELPPQDALRLFETLGGQLAHQVEKLFPYKSPIDCMSKGLVACVPPAIAAMLYEQFAPLLRLLSHSNEGLRDDKPLSMREMAVALSGRCLYGSS